MVDSLFFCATLTGRRKGQNPFAYVGAEKSDTGPETVKLDPRCSWQGHSGGVGAGVGDESTESCGAIQPLHISSTTERCTATSVVVVIR